MTTYTIPSEPAGPLWVTVNGVVSRWTYDACSRRGPWSTSGQSERLYWSELLALGEVSDAHPDLPVDAPLPWTVDGDGDVKAADGHYVDINLHSALMAAFVVRAANAYGEQVAVVEALAQDRA